MGSKVALVAHVDTMGYVGPRETEASGACVIASLWCCVRKRRTPANVTSGHGQ